MLFTSVFFLCSARRRDCVEAWISSKPLSALQTLHRSVFCSRCPACGNRGWPVVFAVSLARWQHSGSFGILMLINSRTAYLISSLTARSLFLLWPPFRKSSESKEMGAISISTPLTLRYSSIMARTFLLASLLENLGFLVIFATDSRMKAKVARAQNNPNELRGLLVKDFNIKDTLSTAWLTYEDIDNAETFDLARFKNKFAIGGADLSKTLDLTCATLLMIDKDTGKRCVTQMPQCSTL